MERATASVSDEANARRALASLRRVAAESALEPRQRLFSLGANVAGQPAGAEPAGEHALLDALALFAGAFLVGAVFQSRAAIGAQRAAEAGDHGEAARQLTRRSWGMRLILVLLLVATWDMVFKPGL